MWRGGKLRKSEEIRGETAKIKGCLRLSKGNLIQQKLSKNIYVKVF